MSTKQTGKGKAAKVDSKEKQFATKLINQGKLTYKEIHAAVKNKFPGFDKSVSWVKNIGFSIRNGGSRKAIGV